ncbi:hypothetical protein BB561_003593 [Smittium simulii]|uniref:Uncharacterized protein n=1 Tax=Smittium simulii TaxID=133385 RepID=A0A2T9YKG1_9FUNG|nr:hypothetical protein BB561_003593 [Smittium simulii]
MPASHDSEFSNTKKLLLSDSIENISKNLPTWFINSTKALNISEELGFLVEIVNILCYRLKKWTFEHFHSKPLSLHEQRGIYNIFCSKGWLIQIALKYRVRVVNRIDLLFRNSLVLVEELKDSTQADNELPHKFDLTQKVPLWQISTSSLPVYIQMELGLSKNKDYTDIDTVSELYSRFFLNDRTLQSFFLFDIFEYIIFSVIKSFGYEYNNNNEPFLGNNQKNNIANSLNSKGFIELATDYIDFLIPITISLNDDTPAPLNFGLEITTPAPTKKYNIKKEDNNSIFQFCDELCTLSLAKFTCEIIAAFWLPHASEPALLASSSLFASPTNDRDDIKFWNWKASNHQILGINCFRVLIERFSAAESWLELKELTDFDAIEFDKDSLDQIKLYEALYELVRKSSFSDAFSESIAWVFGSKAADVADMGSTIEIGSDTKMELQFINIFVDCWLDYILPWNRTSNSRYLSYSELNKKSNDTSANEISLSREWAYRIQRLSKIVVPQLYTPALSFFFNAVVPSFDLLATEPCYIHFDKSKRNYSEMENSLANQTKKSTFSDDPHPKFQKQDINQLFSSLNKKNESIDDNGIYNSTSPFKKAITVAESVKSKVSSTLGIHNNCTCFNNFDILSIILKVVLAIDSGYVKSMLASIEISEFKTFNMKPSNDSLMDTLWTRNILDEESTNQHYNINKINDNLTIFKDKEFGEFRLLDNDSKEKFALFYEIGFSYFIKKPFSWNSTCVDILNPQNTQGSEIATKFFYTVLSYYIPECLRLSLFISHTKIVTPLLLLLFEASQLSKNYSKSLKKAYTSNHKTDKNSNIINRQNNNISNLNKSNQGFITDASNIVSNFLNNLNIDSLLFTNINTVKPATEKFSDAKNKSMGYYSIYNRILYIVDQITLTFGVSPSELDFVMHIMLKKYKSIDSSKINLYNSLYVDLKDSQGDELATQYGEDGIDSRYNDVSYNKVNAITEGNVPLLEIRNRFDKSELQNQKYNNSLNTNSMNHLNLSSKVLPKPVELDEQIDMYRRPLYSQKGAIGYNIYNLNPVSPASYENEYLLSLTQTLDYVVNNSYQKGLDYLVFRSKDRQALKEVILKNDKKKLS